MFVISSLIRLVCYVSICSMTDMFQCSAQAAVRSCGTLQMGLGVVENQHPPAPMDHESQSVTMLYLVIA